MSIRIFFLLWLLPFSLCASGFVVEDILLTGNKKISDGTVFSYLTLKKGDYLDEKSSIKVIKSLYKTGFFNHIEIQREGDTAHFIFDERPSIKEINLEGNKAIDDDAMNDALSGLGISKGKLFNRSILDKIEQELKQLYYSMGKYSVKMNSAVKPAGEGLVEIDLVISEGIPAKVRDINITGNSVFSDDDLLENFSTTIPSQSIFGSSDDYSQAKVSGDLEGIKARYLDSGYLEFDIDSSQVTISPDRKDINIAVNVSEGEQFSISSIDLNGEFVVSKEDLLVLIPFKEGDVFSRKQVSSVIKRLTKRLGEEGYAFANINVIPKTDNEKNTVALNFIVDPGKKMNVRFITFKGNAKTIDKVLRREMRQLESSPFSASKVDRSKVRLQRLKYISNVSVKYAPVKGWPDQMDMIVSVSERFSGNFSVGLGYSEAQGALLNFGLTHDNIFGSGNQIAVDFNNSDAQKAYKFSYNNPFYTIDGISRGFSISFAETDAADLNISNYILDQGRIAVNYGFPFSEFNRLRVSFGLQSDDITLSEFTSDEVFKFITDNDDDYTDSTDTDTIRNTKYEAAFVSTSFSLDTRNRVIFPDRGTLHRFSLEVFTGDLDFYKLGYKNQFVFPFLSDTILSFKTKFGHGDGYNDTTDLPFYEKYYAGGVRTVHGYDVNSLGPRDSKDLPFGGNYQVVLNAEVLFKLEALGDPKTFRLGVFYDAGNVFAESSDIELSELSTSYGLSAKWFSPIGPIEFSYSIPINPSSDDDTKNFQFTLGASF